MAKTTNSPKKEKTLAELKKEFEVSFGRFAKLSKNIRKGTDKTVNEILNN